jgi:hypothetical protein
VEADPRLCFDHAETRLNTLQTLHYHFIFKSTAILLSRAQLRLLEMIFLRMLTPRHFPGIFARNEFENAAVGIVAPPLSSDT